MNINNAIQSFKNKLECVSLLTTDLEIENKKLDQIIYSIIENTKIEDAIGIDLNIIVNKQVCIDKKINHQINYLKKIFNNVLIINLNLDEKEDIYIKTSAEKESIEKIPDHGFKSGPNLVFFRTIKICSKYNTTLLLETDCFLFENWLKRIKNYVENANGFWISGSLYDGDIYGKSNSILMTHINGGTGLYATGCPSFQQFIAQSEYYLIEKIKQGINTLAYDCAIKMFIDENIDKRNEDLPMWKFISRNYLPNKLIGNYSIEKKPKSIEEIQRKFNFAILHKK